MTAANPSAPPPTGSAPPAPPTRPKRARLWPRLLLSLLLFLVLVAGVTRYMGSVMGWVVMPDTGPDGPFVLVTYLPSLGSFESFRKDQSAARAICAKLNLPELPDISGIDEGGQKHFYDMFNRIRNRPNEPDEIGLLGQLCEAQKFPELAEPLYRRAGAADPGDYRWPYLLGLRLQDSGSLEKSDEAFRQANGKAPGHAPAYMRLAWLAIERGDPVEARRRLNEYIKLRPEDPLGYVESAALHLDQAEWNEARSDLEKAQKLGPVGGKGHRCLATLYRHLGDADMARFHLLMSAEPQAGGLLVDEPADMIIRLQTARNPELVRFSSLSDAGRTQEALELVEEVLREQAGKPDLAVAHGRIAEAYRAVGRFPEAEEHARRAIEFAPQDGKPCATLALVAVDSGDFDAGVSSANRALELDSSLHVARYARGLARLNMTLKEARLPETLRGKNMQELLKAAREDLAACVEAKPVQPAYLLALGQVEGLLDDHERAAELLEWVVRIQPQHPIAHELLRKARSAESFWPTHP